MTQENPTIKLADPGIGDADELAALKVLRSGQLVCGPEGRAFESELAHIVGRRRVKVVSSGTTALVACMRAMDIGPGSTVVVPAFTFPAPAAAAAFLGARVKVCDVDRVTFCLSPDTLEPVLDETISMVVAIDQFGVPAPIPQLEELLRPMGVPLIVDAACSIGSSLEGRACGSFGVAATFSFHPRKVITTGEGGAVLTDDEEIADRVDRLVNHGLADGSFESIGINLRLSEIGAALGLSQVRRLAAIVARRRSLAERYRAIPLQFQEPPAGGMTNHQTLAAVLPAVLDGGDRTDLLKELRNHAIEANIASYCLGAVSPIAKRLGIAWQDTPAAFDLHCRGIAFPMHPLLSEGQVDKVVEVVNRWLRSKGIE